MFECQEISNFEQTDFTTASIFQTLSTSWLKILGSWPLKVVFNFHAKYSSFKVVSTNGSIDQMWIRKKRQFPGSFQLIRVSVKPFNCVEVLNNFQLTFGVL